MRQNRSPHQGQPILTSSASIADAHYALILIHGRGATAESILPLAHEFNQPDFANFAPRPTVHGICDKD